MSQPMKSHACSQCGKPFATLPNKPGVFCSITCRDAARRAARHVQTCSQCGTAFHRPTSRVLKSGNRFCSQACAVAWRARNRVALTCARCGAEFHVSPAFASNAGRARRYCSQRCFGLAKRKGEGGEPSTSSWANEINLWRQSLRWPEFSQAWLHGHPRCEACGRQRHGRNLVIHHKADPNPARDPALLFAPENLVVLCRACHVLAHSPL